MRVEVTELLPLGNPDVDEVFDAFGATVGSPGLGDDALGGDP